MRRDEVSRLRAFVRVAESSQKLALRTENAYAMSHAGRRRVFGGHAGKLANVDVPVWAERHAVGKVDIVPNVGHLAISVENLDSMGLSVCHNHPVVVVHDDVMGSQKLSGVDSRLAPGHHMLAFGGVLVNPEVAVAVGDVDVPCVLGHRRVGWAVEGRALPFLCRNSGFADCHEQFAVLSPFGDGVDTVVHAEHRAVGSDQNSVSPVSENALAEPSHVIPVGVEDHHGIIGVPAEGVHMIGGVHRDAGSLNEFRVTGQLVPVVYVLVREISAAKNNRHWKYSSSKIWLENGVQTLWPAQP